VRRTGVLVVGVLLIVWNSFGLLLALRQHAPFFAVAFGLLAVASVVITMRAMRAHLLAIQKAWAYNPLANSLPLPLIGDEFVSGYHEMQSLDAGTCQ
jgi:hypothetical protein